jgi:hypothetical protein
MIGIIVLLWRWIHVRTLRGNSIAWRPSQVPGESKKAPVLIEVSGDDASNELDAVGTLPEMAASEIRHEMHCS